MMLLLILSPVKSLESGSECSLIIIGWFQSQPVSSISNSFSFNEEAETFPVFPSGVQDARCTRGQTNPFLVLLFSSCFFCCFCLFLFPLCRLLLLEVTLVLCHRFPSKVTIPKDTCFYISSLLWHRALCVSHP